MHGIEESAHRFDAWRREYYAGSTPRIDKALVHKSRESNVFVARIELAGNDDPDEVLAELRLDPTHEFFFEHPLEHVPGLMLLEGARQVFTAAAHLFFGVPRGAIFTLKEIEASFTRFAELGEPVFVAGRALNKKAFNKRFTQMLLTGTFVQNGEVLGTVGGRCVFFDEATMARLRNKATTVTSM